MAYLTHINRHDDLNYNEDFEESIARNVKEEIENSENTEGKIFFFKQIIFLVFQLFRSINFHFIICTFWLVI